MAEVIDLSDDDIIIDEAPRKKFKDEKFSKVYRCFNPDCRSEENLEHAQEFVRRYYGVLSYPKKRRACVECIERAQKDQDGLVETLKAGKILLSEKLPPPKDTVLLTDSGSDPSDDESSGEETEYEYEETNSDAGKTMEEIVADISRSLGLDVQVTDGIKHLEERLMRVKDGFDELNKEYQVIEDNIDKVRKDFYNNFRPEIKWLPAIELGIPSLPSQHTESSEVIDDGSVFTGPAQNLPPVGPLLRPILKQADIVFSMKYSLFARWVQAEVVEVEKKDEKAFLYKIRYSRNNKSAVTMQVMNGKQLAYNFSCPTRIPIGARVIAKYKDDDPKNTTISGSFYVGVVAEIPTLANKFRYLIFFDDGYAQYVLHPNIRVVVESSNCVWEDVASDSREFIKEYLQMYPERPMVRLQKLNYIKTEWNGRWWKAQVKEVDGSLVKMFFPLDGRLEWIYRGSTRLAPLFNKKMKVQDQAEQPLKTIRRRTVAPGHQVVEYGTFGQEQDTPYAAIDREPDPIERRSVARKSTSARQGTPPREIIEKIEQESKGEVKVLEITGNHAKFQPHTCSSGCIGGPDGDSMIKYSSYSPLLMPLLFGWCRQISKQRKKTVSKNILCYVTPCARRVRNIEEVFYFLSITSSKLQIDCFSFESAVNVPHEWEPFKKIMSIPDISQGDENVMISCVNSLDNSLPATLVYCNVRQPTQHVPLNLDPEFLVCCDCIDNCKDKNKCACWRMTIGGTQNMGQPANEDAGYHHRRLYEQVQSGIFECNSRCNCNESCLNRVVQHPLRLKLQLFKTARRGWGVRALHDIPRGSFLCVYVGKMLNETIANEEGKYMGGDDYYAELDFIEVMENIKEGYEDEVITPEEQQRMQDYDSSESDEVSGNELDNPGNDADFSHHLLKKKNVLTNSEKRERSARLKAKFKKRSKGGKKKINGSEAEDLDKDKKLKTNETEEQKKAREDLVASSSSDDEADVRQRQKQAFAPSQILATPENRNRGLRQYFGEDETVYIMDAKHTGNIGRYLNHSCSPNVFVQNVFVDTHDLRFPWVAFFSQGNIRAGQELTWDYNYEINTVPGKVKYCYCGAKNCRGRLI